MLTQLQAEVDAAYEDSAVLRTFRRFRQRHMLRIGTNDIIRDRPLEEITRDISRVADTALEVALATGLRITSRKFGEPFTVEGEPARCVVLAFGKLGGKELNYSSDIDLMFLYDDEGTTRGPRVTSISNDDYFARVTTEVVRLLTHTHRPRPGLSRRLAASARGTSRPAGSVAGKHAVLLRHAWAAPGSVRP